MNRKLVVAAALCASALSACQTIDNAGLVYGSRTIGGIDVSGGPQGGTGGANISLGYKREDLAFIPVAVCEGRTDKGCKKIEKLIGSNATPGQDDDADDETSGTGKDGQSAKKSADETAVAAIIKDASLADADKARQILRALGKDSYSVFGSFEGRGIGGGSSVEASAGNIFAAGIAAQNLSKSVGTAMANRSFAYCVAEVSKVKGPDGAPLIDPLAVCLNPTSP